MPVPDDPDDLAVVYGWMRRICAEPADAENCALEVLRRARQPLAPHWLDGRPPRTMLRYLATRLALERRGVL